MTHTHHHPSAPWDAIVIGGSAAGLSAAQALGRSLRRTLVIDAGQPRNRFAAHMHNVLGHDGTPPAELTARGREEAAAYGVELREGSVRAVRDGAAPDAAPAAGAAGGAGSGGAAEAMGGSGSPRTVLVELEGGETLEARALVVATGLRDALPPIPGLAEHWGSGVLHCPYCHGWEVRGQRLAVLTTSPLGAHQAKLLRQWSDDLVVFSAGLGGLDAETERALEARGVVIEPGPVAEIVGDGSRVTAVRTEEGREFTVDAVFTASEMVPHDGFLAGLGLDRAETPAGSFLAVDGMGRTSHPRVWAAGNVVNPAASVPSVMGAGAFAGAAVNFALVEEDFALAADAFESGPGAGPAAGSARGADEPSVDEQGVRARGAEEHGPHEHGAHAHAAVDADEEPTAFWERRYAGAGPVWSGRVNRTLAETVADWEPGSALDLGCGEGGDVLWLAERGWRATGIDLSETAIARAREAAAGRGGGGARFVAADLGRWIEDPHSAAGAAGPFDLVTASFLQSPVELPRERILRAAADRVAPGGRLVVISHAAPPPWAEGHRGPFPSPESELALLGLDPERWSVTAEVRTREATGPDGAASTLDDTVVVAQRIGAPAQ
ncbi:FAD-dependent oxidoreductase [Leucobacter sp.]